MTAALPIPAERLLAFSSAVCEAAGMAPDDARLTADTLVQADLWGHQSHGVMRLPGYVARLKSGVVNPVARLQTLVDAGAVGVIDGGDGMGQVVAAAAARDAIRRARAHGIGAVAVRNSNHFGTAMYFTLMAPPQGCIMFLSTNASPAMAPWGGREKMVGANPWSWASPAGRHPPMVLDIANTGVARGKIHLAARRRERIPRGWAIDEDGEPTDDPMAALAGNILPMGDHKGYGIAVIMDVLSGVLTGSAFGDAVAGPFQAERRSGAGHLLIALNIEAFEPLPLFNSRIEALIAGLKSAKLSKGFDEVLYPGELEARRAARHLAEGLALPDQTVGELDDLARDLGIAALRAG
ncbi:Ldh family oxidoreductase [Phenylobacterium sp.]|uniref:Ldh family oxidoreductase n=1 Tax=Phenylobacterium sp. TaxID=1871053 RepID=UPI00286CFD32|nr:Ldh family oxidoreductase [Phenylobacterium sp.]